MQLLRSFILILTIAAASAATAQSPESAGDPVSIVDRAARERGGRAPVLVLATAHLSALPDDFDRLRFDPLLDRLAAWSPEVIAVEALSGAQCDYLRAYAFAYPETAEGYCPDPAPARHALGMTGPEAEEEVERILATVVADRPAAERRRLAVLFVAIGDPDSALVQWLRLDQAERHSEAALTDELAQYLNARGLRGNENIVIAAALAKRLGLERVYPVDDHTGDRATGPYDEVVFGQEIAAIWGNDAARRRKAADDEWTARLADGGSVVDWYRYLNAPETQRLVMQGDFGAAAGADTPGETGRRYLAYWETRNLRMVANLREAIGPGRRALAIVGASHKAYYERYLGMTSDVELADAEAVLAD